MTVEGKRGSMGREGGSRDQFPVGMRVLAVDDDPTCLKLLETLLLRCQYHVTTTNQAITALKMLRENKDRFDLVISDVHMPDMDGFKLLELVGLEMDLPVIMLSANDETKAVMKGITHGAVDYLLKPVRIEELRNIWQHVLRRRKLDRKDRHNFDNGEDCEKSQHADSQSGQVAVSHGSPDHNGKLNRKRKDQNEDDEDDCEDEDPSAQKKPRVVWSVGLHCKFVAAVNQLGIDKAVPKRILDLMNVENLTRENVASHLQKYRLYLKRLSAMASQQANMVAALGGRDLSNLPMCSMDGFGNFHELLASSQPPAISSSQQNGVVNIMGPTGFGLQGLARSAIVQFNRPHDNTRNPINDIRKLQHVSLPGNQHDNLLQGMPTSLELEKFQQHKRIQESSNPLLLQAQQQHMRSRGLANHSSLRTPSMSADPFEMSAIPLNSYTAKNFPMAASSQDELAPGNMGAYANPMVSQIDIDPLSMTSNSMIAAPPHDLMVGRETQCQASSLGDTMLMQTGVGEDTRFLNFRSIDSSRQKWGESKLHCNHEPNLIFSTSMNSPLFSHPVADPITENQRLNNGLCSNNIDRNMIGHMNFSASLLTQSRMVDKLTTDAQLKDDYNLETSKLQGGLNSNGCSIGDLVNAMIKQEHGDFAFVDGDIGCDAFPLGTCM